mmetsp:Transcript_39857/g.93441  ORF Transcript_39857/g.93441 Transcript_39857/m.93441 type:complete len:215 (+) Transcript_39857:569-1213(+)
MSTSSPSSSSWPARTLRMRESSGVLSAGSVKRHQRTANSQSAVLAGDMAFCRLLSTISTTRFRADRYASASDGGAPVGGGEVPTAVSDRGRIGREKCDGPKGARTSCARREDRGTPDRNASRSGCRHPPPKRRPRRASDGRIGSFVPPKTERKAKKRSRINVREYVRENVIGEENVRSKYAKAVARSRVGLPFTCVSFSLLQSVLLQNHISLEY